MNSRGIGHAPEERHNDAQNGLKRAIGQLKQALASIDKQAPGLTYLGFGCWNVWNTIAFSGRFGCMKPTTAACPSRLC